jgi:hypothetical protein
LSTALLRVPVVAVDCNKMMNPHVLEVGDGEGNMLLKGIELWANRFDVPSR